MPAHPGHAQHDLRAPGGLSARLSGLARGQRLVEEIHLVEGIDQVVARALPEDPAAQPRPGGGVERPADPARLQAQPAGEARAQRPARAGPEPDRDPVRGEALGERQRVGAQRGEGHGMAARRQPLGDQPHRILRAADAGRQVGRLFGEEQEIHPDPWAPSGPEAGGAAIEPDPRAAAKRGAAPRAPGPGPSLDRLLGRSPAWSPDWSPDCPPVRWRLSRRGLGRGLGLGRFLERGRGVPRGPYGQSAALALYCTAHVSYPARAWGHPGGPGITSEGRGCGAARACFPCSRIA